jgi:hypothetical protein
MAIKHRVALSKEARAFARPSIRQYRHSPNKARYSAKSFLYEDTLN